jgi:hypothetical protein
MTELLGRLQPNQRRGSKPRCHLLTHGDRRAVAARLTGLIDGVGVVGEHDPWMPGGFDEPTEAQLHETPHLFPDGFGRCGELQGWWLRVIRGEQTLPSFDIAARCTIAGRQGLLLVEAKAHHAELLLEEKGKPLAPGCSDGSFANHIGIGEAIAGASAHLQRATGRPWAISRDSRYQMSNRFAWAWKVADMGVPVVLVYLGFLNAVEMPIPFTSHADWREAVHRHACGYVPVDAWEHAITLGAASLHASIRSLPVDLPR